MRDKAATEHIRRAEEFLAALEDYLQAHPDEELSV